MRNPDRGASLCFAELPSSFDEHSILARVLVGVLQRGNEASPASPQSEIMGVPLCGFAEVVRLLYVRTLRFTPKISFNCTAPIMIL